MRLTHIIPLALAIYSSTCIAYAAPAQPGILDEENPANLPPALKPSIMAGAKVSYLGKTNVMRSYEITTKKPDGTFYSTPGHVTPDGHALILGYMFVGGHNVTKMQIQRLEVRLAEFKANIPLSPPLDVDVPDPDTEAINAQPQQETTSAYQPQSGGQINPRFSGTTAQDVIARILANTESFTVGTSGPQVFLVTPPNCPKCLIAWNRLFPAIQQNALRVTVVFTPTTPYASQIANNIMQKSDPAGAWQAFSESGILKTGAPENGYSADQIASGLTRNLDLPGSIGENQSLLPFLIAVSSNGHIHALPADTTPIETVLSLTN